MLDVALKLLKEITSNSHEAYIVGGFVRDYILGVESNDIDITTNATPKEILEIFEESCLPNEDYGSVTVIKKGIRFEITTFRKEIEYVNNRKPVEIRYIDDLREDLLRRDFTINTLCMDENANIIDLLGGQEDINAKLIKTVGNPNDKFNEDSLRILRAIRFATILDFSLDEEVLIAIKNCKYLLRNLSYYRKKEELDKIFTSPNYKKGIRLLLDLGLDADLDIPNLGRVLDSGARSLIGIWSLLNVSDKYPFNKNEYSLIKDINAVLSLNNLDPIVLYKYGLYVNSVAAEIKNGDIKKITEVYDSLAIKSRKDIDIDSEIIMRILNRPPGRYLKEIYDDLEKEILQCRLINKRSDICKYIVDNYSD